MTPEEVLAETARRVRTGPWGRGWEGPCLLHHLTDVMGAFWKWESSTFRVCMDALSRETGEEWLGHWNDRQDSAEVVATTCENAKRWL